MNFYANFVFLPKSPQTYRRKYLIDLLVWKFSVKNTFNQKFLYIFG